MKLTDNEPMDTSDKYKIADLVIKTVLDKGASQAAVAIKETSRRQIEIREYFIRQIIKRKCSESFLVSGAIYINVQ